MKKCPNPKCESSNVHAMQSMIPILYNNSWWAYCNNCKFSGPLEKTELEAIATWDALPRLEDIERASENSQKEVDACHKC